MSAIERVWARVKVMSQKHATRGARPSERHARAIICQLMREERVAPFPPDDVIDFYAREMLGLIDRERLTVQ